jgi:hypothetical protein
MQVGNFVQYRVEEKDIYRFLREQIKLNSK